MGRMAAGRCLPRKNERLLALGLMGVLAATNAFGHIDLNSAGTHKSRYGGLEIKNGPCGRRDGVRGTNVYQYKPGETIEIKVREYIPHPGYFRIAFDADGDDDFVNPQSVDPINRECMDDPEDRCGASDFFNTEGVLLDNEYPHEAGRPGKIYRFQVTLPEVVCDNCTLQVLQVMTDPYPIHAPYDPDPYSDDLYYQCIDLVLAE